MVLYYAMTKFHLLFALTHHITYSKSREDVLYLYSGMRDVDDYRKRMLDSQLFGKVELLDEIEMRKDWSGVNDLDDDVNINQNIEQICNRLNDWLPDDLESFSDIYIANDHWALGIYCIHNNIPYYYVEDGVGMLSKPDYSYELVFKQNKTHAYVAKSIGAFGNNKCIKGKYADLNNQNEGFFDDKSIHYSVKEQLKLIADTDSEMLQKILNVFYSGETINISDRNTILFTEHFVNMKRLNIEEQNELYSLLCDYFQDGQLLIKKHPNDIHTLYEKIFANVVILPRDVPSELLPFICNNRLNIGLTACSTSVLGLRDYFNKIIRFDIDIEYTYRKFHKYYVMIFLLNKMQLVYKDESIIEKTIYTNFWEKYGEDFEKAGEILVLDDSQDASIFESISNIETILFLALPNIRFQDLLKKALYKHRLCLIRLNKVLSSNTTATDIQDEYLILYSSNQNTLKKMEGFEMLKELPYTGMKLNVDTITDNEKIKSKILEAMLESANREIDRLLEREKELLKENKELKGN